MNNFVFMVLLSFTVGLLIQNPIIGFLKKLHASQTEREELKAHKKKEGTPTMGGLIFIISILVTFFVFWPQNKSALIILLFSLGYGIIGFLDDYLKVVLHRSDGLFAWQKFLLQALLCFGFIFYLYRFSGIELTFMIPFTGIYFDFGLLTIPFLLFVIVGTVNGVNFTDGLDGLASSVTSVVAVFFGVAAYMKNPDMAGISFVVLGGLLAFLVANVYPAKTFMGDTGSLFLGGYVAATATVLRMPFFLLIVGFIYLIEVLSVIIQVSYFKSTHGKRVFRMAPIHHHFELGGWSETRTVYIFTLITILLALVGIMGV